MKKLMEKLPERSPLKKLQEDLLSKTYLIFSYWIENRHLFKQNFSPYTVIATIYWNEEKDEHEYELEKTFEERLGVEKIKGGNKNVAILRKKRLLLAEYLLKTPGMKEFVKILKDKPQSPEQERLAFHHYFRKNPDVYPKKICYDLNPKAKEEDFTIEDTYISRMKEDKYPACFIFSHNSIQQAKPIRRFIGEQGQDPFCKEYLDAVVWETFVDKCPQILEEKDFLVSIEDKVKKKTEEDIKLPPKKLKIPWKEKISTILSAGIITITGDQLSFEPVEIAPIFQDKTSRLLQCLNISQRIISDWVNTEKDKLIKYIKNIFSDKKATRRHIKINDITLDSKIKNDLNREDKNLLDLSLAKIVIKHRK
ncbi:MAG: hypothetical protein HUU50_00605 [Candidatus Brocadiae bacterium]|nr:hypothetical protein [Candidatus Brocadiia bacterium]